jgi:hypothetical protein
MAQETGKSLPKAKRKKAPEEREILLQDTRTLLNFWLRIREFLLLAFQNDPITREQEQAFLELKSETARCQRVVSGKMPEDLRFGSDKITDFLRQAIAVAHLRGLPMADKRGLVGNWHVASVMLHRAVGALEFINETQQEITQHRVGLRGIKAIKSEAAATIKKSKVPMIIGTIFVLAVVGALYYFLFMTR